ncbi:Uncharacterized membrane protein YheB, UPF0754 family [Alkalispirochaeta americana]|uniref:Uncharacterized membrane protein YheB, UPF0754 family n=1 Tax=Alkalispirochaeta americana TaxID=159291 RepID=A0A1N6UXL3_9SPIO|nr:DUF445 family protein [Alkalispirochaeta americana]SIQ70338.1 Uncharacterized membrane protein YheB, UPF0754 family [Alkalispirochaeta americana]
MIRMVLSWSLPVVVGAAIGYLTNTVAIRMLFRPLRPVMLWKVSLPFTPGVIPRQRGELARSIARMVSQDLLSQEVLEKRFSADSFRLGLQRALSRGCVWVSSLPLAAAMEKVDAERLLGHLDFRIKEFLAGPSGRGVRRTIAQGVARALSQRAGKISSVLLEEFSGIRPLEEISSGDAAFLVDEYWPQVAQAAEELLQRQEVREELRQGVEGVVAFALDQLNPMQRLLVAAVQYDRQIAEKMPLLVDRIIQEITRALHQGSCRRRVQEFLAQWLEDHRHSRGRDLFSGELLERFRQILEEGIGREDPLASYLERHLQGLSGVFSPDEPGSEGASLLVRALRAWVCPRGHVLLGDLLPGFRRRRSSLSRWGARRIQALLLGVTREILSHLDVEELVVSRIDSLEVERVESLLMGIIRRHLRWINVFGALLGAMIGASQVVFRLMEVV